MISTVRESRIAGRRRSIVRRVTVGGKFTEGESEALAKVAAKRGQLLGEWVRDMLLSANDAQQKSDEGEALFTEVQALRLLLINALEPLLRGDVMTSEQFKEMLRYVKANKRKAAIDVLASYEGGKVE